MDHEVIATCQEAIERRIGALLFQKAAARRARLHPDHAQHVKEIDDHLSRLYNAAKALRVEWDDL